ncbi:sulfide dehydrogenase (flavoprotein) subunit SudB [Fervidobacterium changbaicum]|uniref:Sulfide/dihydroorotate dehydrogenase-like FAD/NAD-binding protein n=1 Tax=Fervidobacterium changbaicum TaxID=310769 RepID=A0AAE5XA71_9BACT|nr:sulfide/dihydroorotate dehydrogenase-like FAD/NAD-binding protein [Fervidobacterium changbaicum]QAV32384.1 sulfide/dihydroorotate dehydrogenase-like FAD/NAD-binding protein [Fervidobacterium changbaicum]SDH17649.1 sulfide dehydrogenase (flavoprotein) subunit SudB [Fervidobacterium changbaicum]
MSKIPKNTILSKQRLAKATYEFWIDNALVAENAKPGQFVIIRTSEKGERIPITIADTQENAFRIVVKAVGKSTIELCMKNAGEQLYDIVGPLGKPSEIDCYGDVLIIGGGVGIAAILPIAKALKNAGNKVRVILGAKTSTELILQDEFSFADKLVICTDDGSEGIKGTVVDGMMEEFNLENPNVIWSVGPAPMMKATSMIAAQYGIPIWVSLNAIMVDGTGMCGGCRVLIRKEENGVTKEEIKYVCVDGPEFDGRYVDWESFIRRLQQYKEEEQKALERFLEEVGDISWL